jgi:hypothetical protein
MVWSWNEYNFAHNFVLLEIFLMIVWIVSFDLNFSPNITPREFLKMYMYELDTQVYR